MMIPLGVSAIQNIFIDSKQIVDIRVGNTKIDQVYIGTNLIWERTRPIQEYTTASCPTTRTKVYDARDNVTYWIQKLADNKCWMLTNLAYAGGGENTYNDTKTIINGSTLDYARPFYFMPPDANKTTELIDPSTSTTGAGQYGYLYNWCAAMGVQTGTSACMNAATPLPDASISICPAGWRLPTSNTGGEFEQLNTAINNGSTSASTGLLSTWLGMYSGGWNNGFSYQGSYGDYWSSTQYSSINAYYLSFSSSIVYPSYNLSKQYGFAVRCIAL